MRKPLVSISLIFCMILIIAFGLSSIFTPWFQEEVATYGASPSHTFRWYRWKGVDIPSLATSNGLTTEWYSLHNDKEIKSLFMLILSLLLTASVLFVPVVTNTIILMSSRSAQYFAPRRLRGFANLTILNVLLCFIFVLSALLTFMTTFSDKRCDDFQSTNLLTSANCTHSADSFSGEDTVEIPNGAVVYQWGPDVGFTFAVICCVLFIIMLVPIFSLGKVKTVRADSALGLTPRHLNQP